MANSNHPRNASVNQPVYRLVAARLAMTFALWTAIAAGLSGFAPSMTAEVLSRDYTALDAVIANPERGLYVQFTARGQAEPLEPGALRALRDENITLILRLYYLNEFRDSPIDNARLALIADDLDTAREAGVKAILRFAYNEKIGDPDAPISVVLGHMDQLGPILRENADVIAVVQAGFVGSWGEWHASTNDLREPKNAKQIIGKWLDTLPESRFVQVRTPLIKQMLVDTDEPLTQAQAYTDASRARIAHHNDCFLATDTDMGTYQDIEGEKRYLAQETRFLPMGGETCHVSSFNAVNNARKELARFHWSYLHRDYHPEVIGGWRDAGFLEEIEKTLGYRLLLDRFAVSGEAAAGRTIDAELTFENTGWATPFNPRGVELVLRSQADGTTHHAALPTDPRRWWPGKPQKVTAQLGLPMDLPAGTYDVWLWLPDGAPSLRDRPEYAVRLASDLPWDPGTGMHDLGASVEVLAPRYGVQNDDVDAVFAPRTGNE